MKKTRKELERVHRHYMLTIGHHSEHSKEANRVVVLSKKILKKKKRK